MRSRRVLFVRGTVADVTIQDDEGWSSFCLPENCERLIDAVNVVRIANAQDVHLYARNRAATSSVNVMLVLPSIVM